MSKQTYVLIHGDWHGAWSWERVATALQGQGHTVVATDLPGHGKNEPNPKSVSMNAYVNHVVNVLEKQAEPVILVGHGLSGVVISQVAERCPWRVQQLVYVCAYLLPNGESAYNAMRADNYSNAHEVFDISSEQGTATMCAENVGKYIYNRCDHMTIETSGEHLLKQQASEPFSAIVRHTPERYGRIPRAYIQCMADHVISPQAQAKMIDAMPCDRVFQLDADHAPFYSAADRLSNSLAVLAEDYRLQKMAA